MVWYEPILEPDLHRSFCHTDVLSDPLAYRSSWRRVLVEFDLQSGKLVLCSSLTLLILLLLRKGALSGWAARGRGTGRGRRRWRGSGGGHFLDRGYALHA